LTTVHRAFQLIRAFVAELIKTLPLLDELLIRGAIFLCTLATVYALVSSHC
jgi:hypothetical protein